MPPCPQPFTETVDDDGGVQQHLAAQAQVLAHHVAAGHNRKGSVCLGGRQNGSSIGLQPAELASLPVTGRQAACLSKLGTCS